METPEILSDEELMTALRQSVKKASEGEATPWDRAEGAEPEDTA